MVRADLVREMGVDRKTIRRWLRLGGWQPRQGGTRPRTLDPYLPFIERRGPEVSWNGVVLYRELAGLGFTGGYQQVRRLLKPRRDRRHWEEVATVRFETAPGEQAQVDYSQLQVWIGEQRETVHTCLCSRWATHDAYLLVGIATNAWPLCSMVMSVHFAILAA